MSPYNKDQWNKDEQAWFEYHCLESPNSIDAKLWYHSHQLVTVLSIEPSDAVGDTYLEREENGQPQLYLVRFPDGWEYSVFEDELLTNIAGYERDDPPTP